MLVYDLNTKKTFKIKWIYIPHKNKTFNNKILRFIKVRYLKIKWINNKKIKMWIPEIVLYHFTGNGINFIKSFESISILGSKEGVSELYVK